MAEDGAWAVPAITDDNGRYIKENYAPEMLIRYAAHEIKCHIIVFDLQLMRIQFCSGNFLKDKNVVFESPLILYATGSHFQSVMQTDHDFFRKLAMELEIENREMPVTESKDRPLAENFEESCAKVVAPKKPLSDAERKRLSRMRKKDPDYKKKSPTTAAERMRNRRQALSLEEKNKEKSRDRERKFAKTRTQSTEEKKKEKERKSARKATLSIEERDKEKNKDRERKLAKRGTQSTEEKNKEKERKSVKKATQSIEEKDKDKNKDRERKSAKRANQSAETKREENTKKRSSWLRNETMRKQDFV